MDTGHILILASMLTPGTAALAKVVARKQHQWPMGMGRVLHAKVDYWGGCTHPVVEYIYDFGGRTYWNNRIASPEFSLYLPSGARKVVERFPVGAVVPLFINPESPDQSVLVAGGDKRLLPLSFVFSLSFLVIGLSVLNGG